jgi:hypothetical protein
MDRANTTRYGRDATARIKGEATGIEEGRKTTSRRPVLWWEDWRERSTAWSSRAGRQGSSAASNAATHASISSRPPVPGACGGGGGVCAGDWDGGGVCAMAEREQREVGIGRLRFVPTTPPKTRRRPFVG